MIDKKHILAIGNNRLRQLATFASISVAIILIAAKLFAWLMTDSVAMLSSLFDSIFDLLASLITAYGVASALRPPDSNHRYGHGKAEPLAALAQAVFIIISSAVLTFEAGQRFYHPRTIGNEGVGYAVMALALVLSSALIFFQRYVVGKTGSAAVGADQMHYMGDFALNLAVIAAFALYHLTGYSWFDPAFALIIALGLFISAFNILKYSLLALMDAEVPEAQRQHILSIINHQEGVRGVHDLRTRSDGERVFIDCHVEMEGTLSLREAHDLAEKISAAVAKAIPNAELLVHQDPAGLYEETLDAQIDRQRIK